MWAQDLALSRERRWALSGDRFTVRESDVRVEAWSLAARNVDDVLAGLEREARLIAWAVPESESALASWWRVERHGEPPTRARGRAEARRLVEVFARELTAPFVAAEMAGPASWSPPVLPERPEHEPVTESGRPAAQAWWDFEASKYRVRCSCGWSDVRAYVHHARNLMAKHLSLYGAAVPAGWDPSHPGDAVATPASRDGAR